MPETDDDLIGDTDARHWARRFVVVHRNLLTGPERRDVGDDEETMTAWFAAAITTGRMANGMANGYG